MKITDYLTTRNHKAGRTEAIKYIVIHYVGATGSAEANCKYYAENDVSASAHYYVDFDGSVWRSVKDEDTAWHCGAKSYVHPECRNANSIGIEMCVRNKGSKANTSKDWYFEDATVEAAIELTKELMQKYGIDADHVLRHYDVTGKVCLPTSETELLTKNGWALLSDVKIGDKVASYCADTGEILFEEVSDKVDEHIAETITCRGIEATAEHRMYAKPSAKNSPYFKEYSWGDILSGRKQYLVKNAGEYICSGLPLTDDELRFLVWVQADASYEKISSISTYLRFHFTKERKINRVKELLVLLGISFKEYHQADGTVKIDIKDMPDFVTKWLPQKQYTFDWLEMSTAQFNVFVSELFCADGSVENRSYFSQKAINLDVVQALCALHNQRSNLCTTGTKVKNTLALSESNYSIGGRKKKVDFSQKRVSCVTVDSGYILIRQNGKTFIVGNCPNPYVYNHTKHTWADFKAAISGTATVKTDKTVFVSVRQLKKGSEGTAVIALQSILSGLGYDPNGIDGDFGNGTENAVKSFQKANGLDADGIVGQNTWSAMLNG